MRLIVLIAFLLPLLFKAQDKLFFSNGLIKKVIVISSTKETIYYKLTDTSAVEQVKKAELLMMESYLGVRFIFGPEATVKSEPLKKQGFLKNSFGIQPLGIFAGRANFIYERYINDNKIGIAFPLSITFDPFGTLYNSRVDTNKKATKRTTGINYITGLDVNFYIAQDDDFKLFIGPRFRYGTDMFLRGLEAYTLQTQAGLKIGGDDSNFNQHVSIGFGFAKIVAAASGPLLHPGQLYGWYSINYRINFNW